MSESVPRALSSSGTDLNEKKRELRNSPYMGHDSFQETAYYLRLTADVFPDITLKLETHYSGIIPELQGDANETD